MKLYVAISIDVEPDCTSDWTYSNPLTFTGITKGIGEILQPLFQQYRMAPTYLINNVVLEDKASVDCFKNLKGSFELGTHLHPEFIEPAKEEFDYAGKTARANCCFYPPHIEKEKLKNITTLFEAAFGYKPTSFRAGRFSAGPNTITSLKELGYLVDTSVTPYICWGGKTRRQSVDFSKAPVQPYFTRKNSITQRGNTDGLLQIPVTIGMLRRNTVRALLSAVKNVKKPNFFKRVWLRPSFSTVEEMIQLVNMYKSKYAHLDYLVLNMMFHNIEVLPGLSPYAITDADCDAYLGKLHSFFAYCNENDIEGITLSDLHPVCLKYEREKKQVYQLEDEEIIRNVG